MAHDVWDMPDEKQAALGIVGAGAVGFVQKPFQQVELTRKVAEALGEEEEPAS